MRILFLSHYYAPEVNAPASRTSEHCRIWAADGHDVTVVTCAPSHPDGRIYPGYRNALYRVETVDGVRVVRIWTLLAANEGFLRRILHYLSYLIASVLVLPVLPRADVIVSTSPQFFCGLSGLVARFFKKVPWVLEIRDLWPESIVAVGAMRRGCGIALLERLERLAYRRADLIIAVTRSFVPHIAERCGNATKIAVIVNGADLETFVRTGDGDAVRQKLGLVGKFVVTYVGTHGMAHGLGTILDAAQILKDDPRIAFVMAGGGADLTRLQGQREARALGNVQILGQRPKSEMPGLWAATDVSLIVLRRSDTFKKVLPSKMAEAMAMECPVILGVEGEARTPLDEAGAGIGITPEDAGELVAAIRTLAADPSHAAALGRAGRDFAIGHLDRRKTAARYIALLEDVVAGRTPGLDARCGRSDAMTATPALDRLRRSWAFVRHIPPRKILRRATLTLTRALRDRTGWPARTGRPAAAMSQTPPLPTFPPRAGMIATAGEALSFTFLGRTHGMKGGVDWSAPDPAPEFQLWRMNLHYMDYLEEVDDALFVALIEEWTSRNPAARPGAWKDSWNAYALSLRVVVWMQQIARRRSVLGSSLPMILDSLAVQMRYLEANLETDIGGNHLIKNIKALLWASAFFTGPEAARWRERGLRLLKRSLQDQILACGMHYERSPSYHCQVFADLLDCRQALAASPLALLPGRGLESVGKLDAALKAMAAVTADLAHPDGAIAQFNDSGLAMAYGPSVCLDAFEARFAFRPTPRRVFAHKASGYYGLRIGENYFIADCGDIAPDDLPAHGHGDILSFEWSVAGSRIVVDQGVFDYVAGTRRTKARAASSHNTLCLEGADQAAFYAAFRCGRRPHVTVHGVEEGADRLVLEGSHDGFRHRPGAPRHVRRFDVAANRIVITDRIEGRAGCVARIGFLFHPEVQLETSGASLRFARGRARGGLSSQGRIDTCDDVWWPDMGVELKTRRAWIEVDPGVHEVVTTLWAGTSPQGESERLREAGPAELSQR